MTKTVNCPQCNKLVTWEEESLWKPFCSQRCKMIDLGDWAAENHRIAGSPTNTQDPDIDDYNTSDYH